MPREISQRWLAAEVNNCFPEAQVRMVPKKTRFIASQARNKLPSQSSSYVLYQFICIGDAQYIGHTSGRLSKRLAQSNPIVLRNARVWNLSGALLKHLVDSGHRISPALAFWTELAAPRIFSKGLRKRPYITPEAITIKKIQAWIMEIAKSNSVTDASMGLKLIFYSFAQPLLSSSYLIPFVWFYTSF